MLKYGFDLKYKVAMDETQHVFKCCGNEGIKDWLKIRWYERHYSPNEVIKVRHTKRNFKIKNFPLIVC